MTYHRRWGTLRVAVLVLFAEPARALIHVLHKERKSGSVDQPAHDCYSPYDGKPLVHFTTCARAPEMQNTVADGSCVCLSPVDECCLHSHAICSPDSVNRISMAAASAVQVVHNDAGGLFRNISGNVQPFEPAPVLGSAAPDMSFYAHWRGLTDQHARITAAVDRTPIAQLAVAGTSVEDRTIWAVRFTGANFVPGKGVKVLLTFGVHAREWVSGMSATFIVEKIAQRLEKDPDWLAEDEIVVIPMVNPDGFVYSERRDRLWRKNMHDDGGDSGGFRSCRGVDLNRNFPVDWGGEGSTSKRTCSEVYIGPEPASEPETQAVMGIVDEGHVDLHIDFHSYGQLIMAPWSYKMEPHQDRAEVDELMAAMVAAIKSKTGRNFVAGGSEILYPASGIGPDYATEKGGWGLTVELPPKNDLIGGGGFMLPEKDIKDSVKLTFASVLAAYDWMKGHGSPARKRRRQG